MTCGGRRFLTHNSIYRPSRHLRRNPTLGGTSMHRLRFLLVLAFALTLGASVARGQEGAAVFKDQDQASDQTSKTKAKKVKTDKNSSEHRRHWWSPPSWFHKKHDNAARTNPSGKNAESKTAAATTPASKTSSGKTATTTTATTTTPAPALKTRTQQTLAASKSKSTLSSTKTGTGAHKTAKTISKTGTARKGSAQGLRTKKTSATAARKKAVRHDCSPDEAKKGGCQTDKGINQKGTQKPATSS